MDHTIGTDGKGRIGLFEYDWSMYGFIRDLVCELAESGYAVDVFHKDRDGGLKFVDAEELSNQSHVRYFAFGISDGIVRNVVRKGRGLLRRLSWNYRQNPRSIIEPDVLRRSKEIVQGSEYLCFIGLEKKGLIWAGMLSEVCECPLIYYSLELYVEDHPAIRLYSYLRNAEKKYHQLSDATIIQDKARARVLMKYNDVATTELLYLPIAVRGDVVPNKSRRLHRKYGIAAGERILLYFGSIEDERFSTDLVEAAGHLPDDVVLVLHGYGERSYLKRLQAKADKERVVFSLEFVEEEEIIDVIASASIGLALYDSGNANDRLAAFSSVKVAYHLRCGEPIIAFESESFRELMSAHRCGELIRSIDELPQAVEKILKDYERYRVQSFAAFREFYEFEREFKRFKYQFEGFIRKVGSGARRMARVPRWAEE